MKTKKSLLFLSSLSVVALLTAAIQFSPWQKSSSKVILISFDGFMNQYLQRYLKDGTFENRGFGRIYKEGIVADSMQVSMPSLTATSHISVVTGVSPSKHGIVSNRFHKVTDPITEATNGFSAEISTSTPTLWEQALAQGKTVGVIAYPGVDGKGPRRTADFGVNYTKREFASFVEKYEKGQFEDHPRSLPKTIVTYSKPLKAKIHLKENTLDEEVRQHPFEILVIDTTDDKKKNYDALIFDNDQDLSNGIIGQADLENSPWIGLHFNSAGVTKGSYCKVVSLSSDASSMVIYVGSLYATEAHPKAFQDLLVKNKVFWPGAPERGGDVLTAEMRLEQAIRFSEFFKKATLLAAENMKYDLILTYQPIMDELEHSFLMTDPRQKNYSEKLSQEYLEIIHRGYLQANQVVEDLIQSQPKTNLFIVSDHGMAPIHSVYYINRLLTQHNYIKESADYYQARSFSSGGLSHVYINLKGREPTGVVPKAEFEMLRAKLIALFSTQVNEWGERIFNKVLTREQADVYGLNHPNSGDIILVSTPGYQLSNDLSEGPTVEPASFYGQHGYDPTLDEMKAIFAAWGPDIEKRSIGHITFKDVLPMIVEVFN